jgi:hypothetical protein
MLHKDDVKQSRNHFGSVKIGKFLFKGPETCMEMSPFVDDLHNDYFQMLQSLYVKLVALYHESMPSFSSFLARLQFTLFQIYPN